MKCWKLNQKLRNINIYLNSKMGYQEEIVLGRMNDSSIHDGSGRNVFSPAALKYK